METLFFRITRVTWATTGRCHWRKLQSRRRQEVVDAACFLRTYRVSKLVRAWFCLRFFIQWKHRRCKIVVFPTSSEYLFVQILYENAVKLLYRDLLGALWDWSEVCGRVLCTDALGSRCWCFPSTKSTSTIQPRWPQATCILSRLRWGIMCTCMIPHKIPTKFFRWLKSSGSLQKSVALSP